GRVGAAPARAAALGGAAAGRGGAGRAGRARGRRRGGRRLTRAGPVVRDGASRTAGGPLEDGRAPPGREFVRAARPEGFRGWLSLGPWQNGEEFASTGRWSAGG